MIFKKPLAYTERRAATAKVKAAIGQFPEAIDAATGVKLKPMMATTGPATRGDNLMKPACPKGSHKKIDDDIHQTDGWAESSQEGDKNCSAKHGKDVLQTERDGLGKGESFVNLNFCRHGIPPLSYRKLG